MGAWPKIVQSAFCFIINTMRTTPTPLNQPFSVYLDLVRFLAALAVVLMHMRMFRLVSIPGSEHWTLLGRESVMAFFVLSGFVIAYTTQMRRPDALDFTVARAARIYSVALPVLLLGAYELIHHVEVPYRVVINEAVELTKSFGGTEGYKYFNGDAI